MRTRPFALLAAVLPLTCLPACVICVDHDHCDDGEWSCPTPSTPTTTEIGNYSGAIRAARSISFSADRAGTLNTVAGKPDIDEPSQIMLVDALRGSWGFSGDKTKVLETLVTNPALTPTASLHVANHLSQIASFSGDRKRIADLLANRPLPPAAAATPSK